MPTILSVVAVQGGAPTRTSLEVLTRCREIAAARGWTLAAAVVAPDAGTAADEIARHGAATVYTATVPEGALNPSIVAALAAIVERADAAIVAFPSSEATKEVLGALAARTGAAVLPDVASFDVTDGGVTARRPVMAAKFLAVAEATGERVFVSVRAGSYAASPADAPSTPETIAIDVPAADVRQTLREIVGATTGGAVDLSEATVVVAAGRGVKDAEGKRLVEELAVATGAAIGASRAVVESGLFPATAQIGQTGKVVSPEVYFAVGISGAIQHTAGMSNSRIVVAINRDADAPIHQTATYSLVGDLYQILPALTAEIRRAKGLA